MPVLGIEPAPNVAKAARHVAFRRSSSSSGASSRGGWSPKGGGPSLVAREQRPRPGPRPQRLRRRRRVLLARGRHGDARVSAPRDARSSTPVRHDLPRAFLVLLARHDPADLRRARSRGRRRRGAPDPRWLAARLLRSTQAAPRGRRRRRGAHRRARKQRGCATSERKRGSRRTCESQARAARVPDRRAARGQAGRRLRRARQGQHAPQLLRHPHGLPRVHGRPQPVQAGQFTPGTHIPIHAPERDRRDEAGLHPRPARGTSRRRSAAQLAYTASGARSSSCPSLVPRDLRPGPCRARGGPDEGRHLLRRPRRAHGRGDAARSPSR